MKSLIIILLFLFCSIEIYAQTDTDTDAVSLHVKAYTDSVSSIAISTVSDIISDVLKANRYSVGSVGDSNFTLSVEISMDKENFVLKFHWFPSKERKERTCVTTQGYADLEDVINENMKHVLADFKSFKSALAKKTVTRQPRQPRQQPEVFRNPDSDSDPDSDYETSAPTLSSIYYSGVKVFDGSRRLSNYEVQRIFNDTQALPQYNRGLKQRKIGNRLLWTGVGAAVAGITLSAVSGYVELGGALAVVGCAEIAGGVVLKFFGRKSIQKSVDTYNRKYSFNPGWEFGITRHGIGLAVNF
ncbi:MAG: hypothetical protein LBQ01_07900 [Prevotellaceae bacterium]|jgi:hypothetical protein|nr:hypothetical protein [Prevotellaceae bacterium]